jgi:hypothetical protein
MDDEKCKLLGINAKLEEKDSLGLLTVMEDLGMQQGMLRQGARHAWISRWAAHMSAAAMRSFACSLLHLPASTTNNIDGPEPFLGDILTLHPHSHPPTSLLPPAPALNGMWILHIWTLASIKTVSPGSTSGDWPV